MLEGWGMGGHWWPRAKTLCIPFLALQLALASQKGSLGMEH
jgi:hypothetical protein